MSRLAATVVQADAQTPFAPRCLSRQDAACHCGVSVYSFDDWVRRGILPKPIPGTRRWDRKAIDAALDRLSGITANIPSSPLAEWRARRNARAS